jgi:hypothetical protein
MNKSIFDRLYEDVMSDNINTPEDLEHADAEALELPGSEAAGEEGEVTITLDRELAKKLHDVLMTVLGSEEEAPEEGEISDEAAEEEGHDEDEESHDEEGESHYEATELKEVPSSAGASLQSKKNIVGDETSKLVSKGHGEGGKLTNEPELKPVSDSKGKSLEGKNNKVASKTSKVGSYLAGLK